MAKRLIIPQANVSTNSLTNGVLSDSDTVSGLVNGVPYVAYGLSNPSNQFTPFSLMTVSSITSANVIEGQTIVHTVTLSGALQAQQTFPFSITGNTATIGSDFTNPPVFSNGVTYNNIDAITVPAGVSTFTVSVSTVDDASIESPETYTLSIGGQTATGTINDNDGTPTTVNFTYAQVKNLIYGHIDETTDTTRARLGGNMGMSFDCNCTDLRVTVNTTFTAAGMISVSLDDGATWITAPNTGAVYTLFTGLPQTQRRVMMRIGAAYSSNPWLATTGAVVSITGVNPTLELPTISLMSSKELPNTGFAYSARNINSINASFSLNYSPQKTYESVNNLLTVAMQSFRTRASKMAVTTVSQWVWYKVDDGPIIKVNSGVATENNTPRLVNINLPNDGLPHTIFCWVNARTVPFDMSNIQLFGGTLEAYTPKRVFVCGDSIVANVWAASNDRSFGDVNWARMYPNLGYTVFGIGHSGQSVNFLRENVTGLASYIDKLNLTDSVFDMRMGRNGITQNADTTTTDTAADLAFLINLIASKGVSRIIISSPFSDPVFNPASNGINAALQAGIASSNFASLCRFVDRSGILNTTGDGTHPSTAGYITLAESELPLYAPIMP